jgi:uncharacterized protein YqfB (UPF0267 family)
VLGSDSFLYVTTPHGTLTIRQEGKSGFKPGDTMFVTPITSQTHRFGEDGKRLA